MKNDYMSIEQPSNNLEQPDSLKENPERELVGEKLHDFVSKLVTRSVNKFEAEKVANASGTIESLDDSAQNS